VLAIVRVVGDFPGYAGKSRNLIKALGANQDVQLLLADEAHEV